MKFPRTPLNMANIALHIGNGCTRLAMLTSAANAPQEILGVKAVIHAANKIVG